MNVELTGSTIFWIVLLNVITTMITLIVYRKVIWTIAFLWTKVVMFLSALRKVLSLSEGQEVKKDQSPDMETLIELVAQRLEKKANTGSRSTSQPKPKGGPPPQPGFGSSPMPAPASKTPRQFFKPVTRDEDTPEETEDAVDNSPSHADAAEPDNGDERKEASASDGKIPGVELPESLTA